MFYYSSGLVPEWQTYLVFLLTIIMTAWAATFMAFAASASTKQQAIASLIIALIYVFQMVCRSISQSISVGMCQNFLNWLFPIINHSYMNMYV